MVLVTGCAGFAGSHLTESLLSDGVPVLGIDSLNENYDPQRKLDNVRRADQWDGFEFRRLDLAEDDLAGLAADVDTIFHLAAEPGGRPSWGERFGVYLRNNELATQRLLEATKSSPATRFVYASSSSIYGHAETLPTPESTTPRPFSPYGVTKLAGEHLCSLYHGNYGVDAVALRYYTIYGPRQRPTMAFSRFVEGALSGEEITVYGDGAQTRDFTYVEDIVRATRAAGDADGVGGEVFNVSGGNPASVAEVLGLLEEFAGRPLEVRHVESQRGETKHSRADLSRSREMLSYEPQAVLADGLRAQFDWLREGLPARASAGG